MAQSTIEWVQLSLVTISFPVYVIFLFVLFKFRLVQPFNSDFFKLCRNIGICDLLALANNWLLFKFPSFAWLGMDHVVRMFPVLAKVAIISSWQFGLGQHIGVLSLALNRFTGLVMPMRHQLIWTNKFIRLIISAQWVLPALAVIPQFFLPYGYKINNETGQLTKPQWLDHDMQIIYFKFLLAFNISVNLATLIMYAITFFNTRKRLKDDPQAIRISRHDIILAIYGFCVFVIMFLYGVYAWLRAIMPEGDVDTWKLLILLHGVLTDVFSYCNPWLCLLLLKTVRKHMKAVLICSKNIVVVAPTVPQHRRLTLRPTEAATAL